MIKYEDLVKYTKENHINWNTDLFDVLKGFFNEYTFKQNPHIQQEILFPPSPFSMPADGEFSVQDTLNLFST